ncbi:hypothetical protein JHK87_045652 [Glycine soja]|nr:hypothetical protein JHK87_045652 [Glycine soja]
MARRNSGKHLLVGEKEDYNKLAMDDENKKWMHKETERQRRQEMGNLCTTLRSLLPLEYIKGKRSTSDHVNEAMNYINHLQSKVKQLQAKRDELVKVSNLMSNICPENIESSSTIHPPPLVSIHPFPGGLEIMCSYSFGKSLFPMSRVLDILLKEGLNVVSTTSIRRDGRFIHTIRSEIAVKRLKTMTAKAEMEFAVEVEVLGRVRHKNLLGLRGFYAGGDERLIVYDYMPNHSLLTHLHGPLAKKCQLDWPRRMSIAIGTAEGLAYLHHESTPHIIHRDIKASNVLLDAEFQAKVADFGFAKLVPDGVTHLTTKVKGTLGYLAPEYAMWGKVSESCDVYSFGILLLEIISAKKPIEKFPGEVKRDIVQWVTPYINKGLFNNIADPKLKGKFDLEQLKNVTTIALRCTDSSADKRPSMKEVVDWLKNGVGNT